MSTTKPDTSTQAPNSPVLDPDLDTVSIPRPANELDGEGPDEEPDEDPQKAG